MYSDTQTADDVSRAHDKKLKKSSKSEVRLWGRSSLILGNPDRLCKDNVVPGEGSSHLKKLGQFT